MHKKVTLLQCLDIYRGSKAKNIMELITEKDCELFGKGNHLPKTEVERILKTLIIKQILIEKYSINAGGFVSGYLKIGPKANQLSSGKIKITLETNVSLNIVSYSRM